MMQGRPQRALCLHLLPSVKRQDRRRLFHPRLNPTVKSVPLWGRFTMAVH